MQKIVYKTVGELIPYARNSRTHTDKQISQIMASIKEFGFTNPILTDGENGIIAGHGRVLAAQRLGLAEVPTIELSHLTEGSKKAYIIADNKLALNAGWDEEMLKIELEELDEFNFDLDLTGFERVEVNKLLLDEFEQEFEKEDFLDKNKEIDVDDYENSMELKFKLTFAEYNLAKEKLKEIANTPETALKILLKMEL